MSTLPSLCGIDSDPDAIIQHIAEVNPYLAIQCVKSGVIVSSATNASIVNVLKRYLDGNAYYHPLMLLGDVGSDEATYVILVFLRESKNDSVRREHAVQALGRTKNPIANSALIDALQDEDEEVRWFSALAISKMPDRPIEKVLKLFKAIGIYIG